MKAMKQSKLITTFLCFVILLKLLCAVPAIAIGMSDIKADDIDFDLSAGEFTATGNVKIESDELTLSADDVQAKVDGTQLLSITASGKPLQLQIVIDDEDDGPQTIRASAHKLTFNNEENWVEFVDEAQLQTDVANIRAQKIRIELDTQKIFATKGEESEQVEITLRDEESP